MINPNQQFSPITNEARFTAALDYIATQAGKLAQVVLGEPLPIDTVCIFAQSQAEYDFLLPVVRAQGELSAFTHDPTTYVEVSRQLAGQDIKILGVRAPDKTRPQIGYGDYPIADYAGLQTRAATNPHLTVITSGRGQSLIEFRHPDFDILGYAFDQQEH